MSAFGGMRAFLAIEDDEVFAAALDADPGLATRVLIWLTHRRYRLSRMRTAYRKRHR